MAEVTKRGLSTPVAFVWNWGAHHVRGVKRNLLVQWFWKGAVVVMESSRMWRRPLSPELEKMTSSGLIGCSWWSLEDG